ncbi:hypothetical protein H696_06218 [Fonticula alba]|uniref:Uncharacterized protein n=1 Tax=Fonticula alba TaxID=691883 RepID=A0A058YZC8_FONAL|nr:hypothetical protein H696_06218 [Fonticula alba]KCV67350.1 hypothetical protein H696_06218 [Fonticula alba]|eukprot:XP_009498239.1 hypothetical protein H696_06218 [Fonticula alba]
MKRSEGALSSEAAKAALPLEIAAALDRGELALAASLIAGSEHQKLDTADGSASLGGTDTMLQPLRQRLLAALSQRLRETLLLSAEALDRPLAVQPGDALADPSTGASPTPGAGRLATPQALIQDAALAYRCLSARRPAVDAAFISPYTQFLVAVAAARAAPATSAWRQLVTQFQARGPESPSATPLLGDALAAWLLGQVAPGGAVPSLAAWLQASGLLPSPRRDASALPAYPGIISSSPMDLPAEHSLHDYCMALLRYVFHSTAPATAGLPPGGEVESVAPASGGLSFSDLAAKLDIHAATAIMSSLKLQYVFLSLGPDFARLDLAQEMGFVTGVCHRVALPRWGDSPDACCPVPLSGTEHLLLESAKPLLANYLTLERAETRNLLLLLVREMGSPSSGIAEPVLLAGSITPVRPREGEATSAFEYLQRLYRAAESPYAFCFSAFNHLSEYAMQRLRRISCGVQISQTLSVLSTALLATLLRAILEVEAYTLPPSAFARATRGQSFPALAGLPRQHVHTAIEGGSCIGQYLVPRFLVPAAERVPVGGLNSQLASIGMVLQDVAGGLGTDIVHGFASANGQPADIDFSLVEAASRSGLDQSMAFLRAFRQHAVPHITLPEALKAAFSEREFDTLGALLQTSNDFGSPDLRLKSWISKIRTLLPNSDTDLLRRLLASSEGSAFSGPTSRPELSAIIEICDWAVLRAQNSAILAIVMPVLSALSGVLKAGKWQPGGALSGDDVPAPSDLVTSAGQHLLQVPDMLDPYDAPFFNATEEGGDLFGVPDPREEQGTVTDSFGQARVPVEDSCPRPGRLAILSFRADLLRGQLAAASSAPGSLTGASAAEEDPAAQPADAGDYLDVWIKTVCLAVADACRNAAIFSQKLAGEASSPSLQMVADIRYICNLLRALGSDISADDIIDGVAHA